MKDFKLFPSKTCLKYIKHANINMGLTAHIFLPTPKPHWLFQEVPLDFKIQDIFILSAVAAGPHI